jgi:2-dehydropantoate 2-reductase
MDFTVIGAGAIGGTVGAYLVRAGHDVLFCDVDPDHVEAMNRDGLSVEGPIDSFIVPVRAVLPSALPDRLTRVIVAVKSHHTASAAELLRTRLTDDGYVLSLQNGLTADAITEVVGADRLVVGFVNFGADYLAPGRIVQGNVAAFRIGEPSAPVSARVRELTDVLPWAEPTDNIAGYLWAKEAYGALLFVTAVSDLPIADVLADVRWRPLLLAVAREVLAQAPVRCEPFDGFDPDDLEGSLDRLVVFNRASAKTHTGIYRDLMVRHRKTEVEDLLDGLDGPLTTYIGELIRAIERGERTCERANLELLAAYERLERLGRPLNAVVTALLAPQRATAGPLHGLAVAVKDMIDVAGQPRGNGNPIAMAGDPAEQDADVVMWLRAAGADVFALSSLLEYAAGAVHPDLPEARNPHDLSRTAGGSSGGSAARVGAGVCAAALGTDSGGSTRIPAHYCGIVGLKPTHGLLSLGGVQELSPTLDHVGILADNVTTAARVLSALAPIDIPSAPRRLRIGVLTRQLESADLDPSSREALMTAIAALQAAGAEIVPADDAVLTEACATFGDIVLYEAWVALGHLVDGDPGHFGADTLRLLRAASAVDETSYVAAMDRRRALLPAADALAARFDALLGPAVPFTAPTTTPHVDSPLGEIEGLFTEAYDVTGQPAIVLPCGWVGGLPIGLQLAAERGADGRLLAIAAEVERILAW